MIREMPLPTAKDILKTNLPYREFCSIYYADCEGKSLIEVGDMLGVEESTIKKLRQSAFKKLVKVYFK